MMKKWERYDENHFGDFSSAAQFGIEKKSSDEYTIGRFVNFKKNGLCIDKFKDGSAIFGMFKDDEDVYPIIHINKSGSMTIILGEDNKGTYYLSFNEDDQSFLYQLDVEDTEDDPGIYYNGKDGSLIFTNVYRHETEQIARKFIPDRPIVNKFPLLFPSGPNFEKFEFRNDANHAVCENSLNSKDPGVGIITWNDGHYCVGGWLDNTRQGYQIYYLDDDNYFFFYGGVDLGGYYVRRYKDGVYIKSVYSNKHEDNSYMLAFSKGQLSFSEIDKEYLLSKNGPGIEIKDMNTISFVQYSADKVSKVEDTYKKKNSMPEDKNKTVTVKFGDIRIGADSNNNNENTSNNTTVKQDDSAVKKDAEYQIMNLVGQAEAKKEFTKIKAYLLKNNAIDAYTNMFFTGGSGVGKTTFARLLAKFLYECGATENDNYFEVSAKELFSNFDGQSSNNIKSIFSRAQGGVFFIDDAKYLSRSNNSGIKEAINTIANLMRDNKDTTIILSDNKFNIDDLYENNKDVLEDKIRFRIDFSDFSREELKEIIKIRAAEKGYTVDDDAMQTLLDVIFLAKAYGSEINATAALAILEKVIVIQNVRTAGNDDKVINREDVRVYIKENEMEFVEAATGQSDARKKLDELIGLEHIKETIDDLIAYFAMNRGKKVDCHMCFTGNPGTGKTEVARILGKLLRQEGILPTSKFVEATRRDLVAEYVGQSAIRTREVIDKAMGGVLYIDEAYSLAYGGEKDFGREVIAELLKAMEDRRGEFIVILAGYTSEMKKLFDVNPGFYSRIKFNLEFEDYNEEELIKITELFLKRDGYVTSDENVRIIVRLVENERNKPNFANVRTLREYLSRIQIKQASRIRKKEFDFGTSENEIIIEDIMAVFGREAVNEARFGKNEVVIPKLDPARLRELYRNYPKVPFFGYRDFVEEVVVAISTSGPQGGESSGFFITNDGYIATCAHCVSGAEGIKIRRRITHRGKRIDIYYQADIVSIDEKNDVAVIKVRTDNPDEEFDFIALADPDYILPPLAEIYEMGYPFGVSRFDEMTVNVGKVGSYQKGKNGEPDQINLDISAHGGNSGSLIADAETSRVIGTLTGAALSPHGELIETIIFCRPISYIWAMLERDFKKE